MKSIDNEKVKAIWFLFLDKYKGEKLRTRIRDKGHGAECRAFCVTFGKVALALALRHIQQKASR